MTVETNLRVSASPREKKLSERNEMKVVLINGSPRENGNTARALKEVADTLASEGIGTETVWIGNKPVRASEMV